MPQIKINKGDLAGLRKSMQKRVKAALKAEAEKVQSAPCPVEFRELTCDEFRESIQRPDAPQFMRDFADIICDDKTSDS